MLNIPLKGVNRKGFKPSREEKNPLLPTPPQRIKSQKETDFLARYKKFGPLHRLILGKMVFLSRLQYERNGKFYCYPSLDWIAGELDESVRTIRRRVKELSEREFVKITKRRPLPDGTKQTNLYKPWTGLLSLLREQNMEKALGEFFSNERKEEMSEEQRIRSCGRPYDQVRPEPADEEKPGATFGPLVSLTLRKERLKISHPKKDKGPLLAPGSEENPPPTPPKEVAKKGNFESKELSESGSNGIAEHIPPTPPSRNGKTDATLTEPVLGEQWWKPEKKLSEMYTGMRKELRQATLARARSEAYIQKEKEDSIEVVVNEQKAELVYEN